MRTKTTLLITILVSIWLVMGFEIYDEYQTEDPVIQVIEKETIKIIRVKQVYYERMEINSRIMEIQAHEDYDKVISLYGEIARSRELAMLILNNALVKRVPVNVAFALCRQESNFNVKAKNENIKNGKVRSSDYGLFQINTTRFKTQYREHGLDWIMIPENNVEVGLSALRDLHRQHGSWDVAIIKYNGRYEKGADMHLVRVYEYERQYDKLFNNL